MHKILRQEGKDSQAMEREMTQCSYVFYGSFYEALKEVDQETRLLVYDAINEYALFAIEPQLSGTASALFKLMRPQIDANRKKRESGKIGGSKSGAKKQSASGLQAKGKQSAANVNANADENGNENDDLISAAKTPSRRTVITLLLNNESSYPVSQEEMKRWEELYPAVDIMQELRKMAGWLEANPTRRKTARGIKPFIVGWLSREQDKGRPAGKNEKRSGKTDEREYAPGELDAKIHDPIAEILARQEKEQKAEGS